MINRILIRIKVVQMLYSYLLNHTDFHIDKAPEKDTADARYAYSLYLQLLLIILELGGLKADRSNPSRRNPIEQMGQANLLADNRLARALAADTEIRDLVARGDTSVEVFDPVLSRLYSQIVASSVYQDYRKKKRPDLDDEVQLWAVILETIMASEPLMLKYAKKSPDFTSVGYRRAFELAAATLNNFNSARSSLVMAKKQLTASLDKAYDLYVALLRLPVYLTDMESERLEQAKQKYRPTPQDLNPNLRFVNNRFVSLLRDHPDIEAYAKRRDVAWDQDYFLLKDLLDKIRTTDTYRDYMEAETTSLADDCEFWRTLMKNVILPSDVLAETLETKSVYWNDDLQIMGQFVLKTIRQIGQNEGIVTHILPQYKDDEDAAFGQTLFADAVTNRDQYRDLITRFIDSDSWDPERTAFMDVVILTTAIAEMLNFPAIPLPVTLNEYIEIANYYSTPRSGQFVNGILFSVINHLKEQGLLQGKQL